MNMPEILLQFLRSLTPAQADELWLYFDGCTNEGIIEVLIPIAVSDPKIAAKNLAPDTLCSEKQSKKR